MYQLILSKSERDAIDWVGGRYEHGSEFRNLLMDGDVSCEWDSDEDMLIRIPEHVAWEIQDLLKDCLFDCFNQDLIRKIYAFLDKIV